MEFGAWGIVVKQGIDPRINSNPYSPFPIPNVNSLSASQGDLSNLFLWNAFAPMVCSYVCAGVRAVWKMRSVFVVHRADA